jgi:hypothetical protein
MLLPAVSVTVVGLIAGLIFVIIKRIRPLLALFWGVAGAWIGFILGAVCGVTIDVIAQTGIYVGIAGHIMALLGSTLTLLRFPAN